MRPTAPVLWHALEFDTDVLECNVARIDGAVSVAQLQEALTSLEQTNMTVAFFTTQLASAELAAQDWFYGAFFLTTFCCCEGVDVVT